ncbi:hypothetical protein SAMN05519103_04552 [Rhizobiales bacterium GAS113]|nr:hypothetical protein SAMN05519103_04552 [Rhizobiales bacterium GAS113]
MLESFAVGSVFRITNEASPALRAILKDAEAVDAVLGRINRYTFGTLKGELDVLKVSMGEVTGEARLVTDAMKGFRVPPGLGRSLDSMERRLTVINAQSKAAATNMASMAIPGVGSGGGRGAGAVGAAASGFGGRYGGGHNYPGGAGGGGRGPGFTAAGVPVPGGHLHAGHSAAGYAAVGGLVGVYEAIKYATSLASVQSGLRIGGVPESKITQATSLSYGLAEQFGQPVAEVLKTISEIRNPLGGIDPAMEHIKQLGSAMVVLRSMDEKTGGNVSGQLYNLIRSAEFRNAITGPEFDKAIDMMVRADVATGGKVTPADFFQFSKYARGSLPGLSDRFLYSYGPELAQEFKGSGAGTVMSGLYQQIVGGMMSTTGLSKMQDLDMLRGGPMQPLINEKNKLVGYENEYWLFDKYQNVVKSRKPGGIVGSEVFEKDPDKFFEIMMQHEAAQGISDPDAQRRYNAQIFRRGTTTQFANVLMQQMGRLDRGAAGIAGTMSTYDAAQTLLARDPATNMRSFTAAWTNMLTAAGGPLIEPAITGMRAVTQFFKFLGYVEKGVELPGAAVSAGLDKLQFGGNADAAQALMSRGWTGHLGDAWEHMKGYFGGAADLPAPGATEKSGMFNVPGIGWTDEQGNNSIRDGVYAALKDYFGADNAGGGGSSGGGGFGGGGAGGHHWSGSIRYGHMRGPGATGTTAAITGASNAVRESFIKNWAIAHGKDPNEAWAVALSEGARDFAGDHGWSLGDFQLNTFRGVGVNALKHGVSPKDWKAWDTFGMEYALGMHGNPHPGWGEWSGARKQGIGVWHDIHQKPSADHDKQSGVYMDGKPVGKILMKRMAQAMNGPSHGSQTPDGSRGTFGTNSAYTPVFGT